MITYAIPNPSFTTGPNPPAITLGDDKVLVLKMDLFKNLYSYESNISGLGKLLSSAIFMRANM